MSDAAHATNSQRFSSQPFLQLIRNLQLSISSADHLLDHRAMQEVGDGPKAWRGAMAQCHYVGKLETGRQFDASKANRPFSLTLGQGAGGLRYNSHQTACEWRHAHWHLVAPSACCLSVSYYIQHTKHAECVESLTHSILRMMPDLQGR